MKLTILASALAICAAAAPLHAGGPVLVAPEEAFVQEARPSSEGQWIVPVVIGALILCAIACGGDDTPAPVDPGPVCKGEGC